MRADEGNPVGAPYESQKQITLGEQETDNPMKNKRTEKVYTGYLKDFFDYNEHENGKGITDEVTLCNFISFLRENRFSDGSLWCVYHRTQQAL